MAISRSRSASDGRPNPSLALRLRRLPSTAIRYQAVTAEFLKEMGAVRTQMTDTARALHDLRTAFGIGTVGPDSASLSSEGYAFKHQVENFLGVVGRYYGSFFTGPGNMKYLGDGGRGAVQ